MPKEERVSPSRPPCTLSRMATRRRPSRPDIWQVAQPCSRLSTALSSPSKTPQLKRHQG